MSCGCFSTAFGDCDVLNKSRGGVWVEMVSTKNALVVILFVFTNNLKSVFGSVLLSRGRTLLAL